MPLKATVPNGGKEGEHDWVSRLVGSDVGKALPLTGDSTSSERRSGISCLHLFTAVVLVLLSACDSYPALSRSGISLTSAGNVQIHYALCSGEVVRSVEVYIPNDLADLRDDVVLWKIVSSEGSTKEIFTVGKTPRGFDSATQFKKALPLDKELHFEVDSSDQNYAGWTFRFDDLETQRIEGYRDGEDFEDVRDFRRAALAFC